MNIPDKRDALGEIPGRFDTMLANALANEEVKPMKRKLSTSLVMAALLIVLLAATALAVVSISRSQQGDALHTARQALGEKYGLTTETLGLFMPSVEAEGEEYTFQFSGEFDRAELGTYTIIVSPGGKAEATWSHDDVDPALWQDGNMDAPVWGQAQMMTYLAENDAYWQEYAEVDWENADFETVAAYQKRLQLVNPDDTADTFYYTVPNDEDIATEEAVRIARQAFADTYAMDAGAMITQDGYEERISFVESAEDGTRQYVIEYSIHYSLTSTSWLTVQVAASSGEVIQCRWFIDDALRTLPEGPLDAYHHAVAEFMAYGALAAKPAAEKADIVARVKAAGWDDLIAPALPYAAPGGQDISEDAALAAARQALIDEYAFTTETLTFYKPITSLLETEDGRRWTVDFATIPFKDWYIEMEKEKLGSYAVVLDAATGDVLSNEWDQADAWKDEGFTESNWASSPVYHGKLLPWLHDLTEEIAAIADKYTPPDDTLYDYSDEDIAAYDEAFRSAGYPVQQFYHAMPGPGDITKEEALAIGKEALLAEMSIPEEILDTMLISSDFSVRNPDAPEWGFSFQFTHEGVFVDFGLTIDARTGEVLYAGSITGAVG